MPGYYAEKLSAERLKRCYELATPAVATYLENEILFVLSHAHADDRILELGCGYGRVLSRLPAGAHGIDTSLVSLQAARKWYHASAFRLAAMDAAHLGFKQHTFDLVVCIQNGISAFGVAPVQLIREAVRVTSPGGRVLFSSYAEKFWPDRLEWFKIQAASGLIGELNDEKTANGVIVCKDGFRATTVTPGDFRRLAAAVGIEPSVVEVAGSSLFCELTVPS